MKKTIIAITSLLFLTSLPLYKSHIQNTKACSHTLALQANDRLHEVFIDRSLVSKVYLDEGKELIAQVHREKESKLPCLWSEEDIKSLASNEVFINQYIQMLEIASKRSLY